MNETRLAEVTRDEAIKRAKEFFNNKTQFVALIDKNLDPNEKDKATFLVNIEAIYS